MPREFKGTDMVARSIGVTGLLIKTGLWSCTPVCIGLKSMFICVYKVVLGSYLFCLFMASCIERLAGCGFFCL